MRVERSSHRLEEVCMSAGEVWKSLVVPLAWVIPPLVGTGVGMVVPSMLGVVGVLGDGITPGEGVVPGVGMMPGV